MPTEIRTEHPYVVQREGPSGAEPHIRGKNIAVRHVVGQYRHYGTIEGVLSAYPDLTVAQVHDALSYYYDHSAEIEGHTHAHSEETWRQRDLPKVWRQNAKD
jgi:uncharacterized protein (DUF433 family)